MRSSPVIASSVIHLKRHILLLRAHCYLEISRISSSAEPQNKGKSAEKCAGLETSRPPSAESVAVSMEKRRNKAQAIVLLNLFAQSTRASPQLMDAYRKIPGKSLFT
jgi:hypothetical protein